MASSVAGRRSVGPVIRRDPGSSYATLFNPSTGFLARTEDSRGADPFWAPRGPELLDISITNWCDRQCATCYRSSSLSGLHMSRENYSLILAQAAECGVFQIALGGGNPNQHPDFVAMLRATREDFGLIPNYTTNGRGLCNEVVDASARYCGAVAVSAYEPIEELEQAVTRLADAGVKVNLHFVLDAQSIQTALSWLRDPPRVLMRVNAVVFLTFKPVGRGADHSRLLRHGDTLAEFVNIAMYGDPGFRVGFDSCMASAFAGTSQDCMYWLDGCEAARFSMFISERLLAYPCSFMEGLMPGMLVKECNLQKIWQEAATFRAVRARLARNECEPCDLSDLCRGACPAFSVIRMCRPPSEEQAMRARQLETG